MVAWPNVEYGHIFSYLITCPGVYTLEQLLYWKKLEGIIIFRVIIVVEKVWCNKDICVLKAFINPSQSAPDKAYEACVITKVDGTVITGHCTCMTG